MVAQTEKSLKHENHKKIAKMGLQPYALGQQLWNWIYVAVQRCNGILLDLLLMGICITRLLPRLRMGSLIMVIVYWLIDENFEIPQTEQNAYIDWLLLGGFCFVFLFCPLPVPKKE